MLLTISVVNKHMVSHKRSITAESESNTSFLNPIERICFQICSIGFISGVYGGMERSCIFSGQRNAFDLCHAAPSHTNRIISSGYCSEGFSRNIGTFCIAIRHRQKETFSAQRFYCSKAEYRLLATLCRVRTFTVLYHLHRTGAPPMLFILSPWFSPFYRLFFTGSLRSNRGAYMKLYTATDLSFKVTNHVAPPVN